MIANSNSQRSYGIEFNGVRSNDLGLDVIEPKTIGFPAKKKITQALPFSNTVIDLSDLYGGQAFDEREIKITFLVIDRDNLDKESLYVMWTKTVNWLMGSNGKAKLYDDWMNHYYYLADVESAPTWDEYLIHGKFTVTFKCYPFRINDEAEGNDIWDDFNFDLDVAQETEFDISGTVSKVLINVGEIVANPTITSNAAFTIVLNGTSFSVTSGTTSNPNFVLDRGENTLVITGSGHLKFTWYKELI